jgi:hypothetical protein
VRKRQRTQGRVSHAVAFSARPGASLCGGRLGDPETRRFAQPQDRELSPRERELFEDTPFTRPGDFHSWPRAYSQALAEAGASAHQAQALAGHASIDAH